MSRHGLRPDKGFGQNFLVDASTLADIVNAAEIAPQDTVLEVGPGLGVLTRELATLAGRVVSAELDERLEPVLAETLSELGNVELVWQDALEFDFGRLPEGSLLVANLPYNIATPLVAEALKSGRFKRLVFLVQREVAERFSASPGTKAYGAVSLIVKHFGEAEMLRDVKPGAFFPPPKVTSSVVRIRVDPEAETAPELFAFIRAGFAHRRKTLRKNLVMAGYDANEVSGALERAGLEPNVRAEALDLDQLRHVWLMLNR